MRQWLLATLVLGAFATPLFAQGGTIGIFEDQAGINCNLVDNILGLKTFWVVHIETGGATSARFSAPVPACMAGAIWLSDTNALDQCDFGIPENNTQMGFSCGYGGCLSSPIAVVGINLFLLVGSSTCCPYPVLADPNAASGQIEVTDCDDNVLTANGLTSYVNGDSSCPCYATVAAETSTWGAIKGLFQ